METFMIFALGILWVGIGTIVVLGILSLWCKLYKRLTDGE